MKKSKEIAISKNLNRLMKNKGLTISGTAKKVGMNKATLHNYCNGVVPRNLITLNKLAEFFGISLSELVFELDSRSTIHIEGGLEGHYELVINRIGSLSARSRVDGK